MSRESIDVLVVGAGFSGLVMAERLTTRQKLRCVVIDQRGHIGGNAHDHVDAAGVLIHSYGPHYFRSNAGHVVDYLSAFTDWHSVDYRIKSFADGRYWTFPICLGTYEEMLGKPATEEEFKAYLEGVRENIPHPANSEEAIVSQVGRELYERFFEGYTLKQWKRHPRDIDASVCGRVPIRTNRDDRYLREEFQAMPSDGYTKMFERMIDASPGLRVELETELGEARKKFSFKHLVYTGPLDSYFEHALGHLPYRSLRFEAESFQAGQLKDRPLISRREGFWQPAVQVNYPSADIPHTRIVEIKHVTGQQIDATNIVREFPADYEETGEPYYPVPTQEARDHYRRYRKLADRESEVTFLGRLARYQYYNMDQVVAAALKEAENGYSL